MFASWHGSEIPLIQAVQAFHFGALDWFMNAVSFLGADISYLVLAIWLWSSRSAKPIARIAVMLFISVYLNSIFKEWLHQPRPFQFGPVLPLGKAEGFGIPSGHAQSSMLFWVMVILLYPASWLTWVGTSLIFLIAVSRVYLGVHFPTDILGGWLLAGGLLFAYFKFHARIERILIVIPAFPRVALVGLFCAGLFELHSSDAAAASLGAFFGLTVALSFFRLLSFNHKGALNRFVQTLAGAAVLYIGLHRAFPVAHESGYLAFRFIQYTLLTFWVGGLSPWLYARVHPRPSTPPTAPLPEAKIERSAPPRMRPIEIPGITRTRKPRKSKPNLPI